MFVTVSKVLIGYFWLHWLFLKIQKKVRRVSHWILANERRAAPAKVFRLIHRRIAFKPSF